MKVLLTITALFLSVPSFASQVLESKIVPFGAEANSEVAVLKNDGYKESGGQAYLQLGFVKGEKAGVWLKVPDNFSRFKVDSFRVLIGSSQQEIDPNNNTVVYFHMGINKRTTTTIPIQIQNAAQITPGPYWNDIPAQGYQNQLGCAKGGEFIGAALEFDHSGAPSVYRDVDGLSNVAHNVIFAIPGGWNYSASYGLRGDWILRVTGHEAEAGECG